VLSDEHKTILNEIVAAEGSCMDSARCMQCPFRAKCLPKFLTETPPTPRKRLKDALDSLAHDYFVDDGITDDDAWK
jgi:hypothetical protein